LTPYAQPQAYKMTKDYNQIAKFEQAIQQKYGEEGAEEVFGRWSECFTDDGQDAYFTKRPEM